MHIHIVEVYSSVAYARSGECPQYLAERPQHAVGQHRLGIRLLALGKNLRNRLSWGLLQYHDIPRLGQRAYLRNAAVQQCDHVRVVIFPEHVYVFLPWRHAAVVHERIKRKRRALIVGRGIRGGKGGTQVGKRLRRQYAVPPGQHVPAIRDCFRRLVLPQYRGNARLRLSGGFVVFCHSRRLAAKHRGNSTFRQA